ncbi:hypothetical protein KKG45_10930, partial [bacterium]|nr:hypothetical protein [bacterium]
MTALLPRCGVRRCPLLPVAAAALLAVCTQVAVSYADAYVLEPKRGRTRPVSEASLPVEAAWGLSVVVGASAGGDVFRVKEELTTDWTAPVAGETFQAQRFTVTLDESVLLGFCLARRMTPRGWLCVDFSWTEMDATALANDSQFVKLVHYDTLTMVWIGLGWEQRLLDTPLAPFLSAGVGYLDVSARADYLSQSKLAPRIGAGAFYSLAGAWRLRGEISDTVVQLRSEGITEANWPL